MPLQGSGQINISQINAELGLSNSNSSLAGLSGAANNTDPCNLSNLPGSNGAPHAMSEFYAYDHNCTSGPSLLQCNIAGPFGSPDEACAVGFEFCEIEPLTVFTDGESCCPEFNNAYYTDSNGNGFVEPGWYYACECSSPYAFLIEDSGFILETVPCG